MQDRYTGDIGDFAKYGLLRAIARGRRLGVAWYLNSDGGPAGDGRHVNYLWEKGWRELDPELFESLKKLVRDDSRSVRAVQDSGLLGDCVFAEDSVDFSASPGPESSTTAVHLVRRRPGKARGLRCRLRGSGQRSRAGQRVQTPTQGCRQAHTGLRSDRVGPRTDGRHLSPQQPSERRSPGGDPVLARRNAGRLPLLVLAAGEQPDLLHPEPGRRGEWPARGVRQSVEGPRRTGAPMSAPTDEPEPRTATRTGACPRGAAATKPPPAVGRSWSLCSTTRPRSPLPSSAVHLPANQLAAWTTSPTNAGCRGSGPECGRSHERCELARRTRSRPIRQGDAQRVRVSVNAHPNFSQQPFFGFPSKFRIRPQATRLDGGRCPVC